MRCFIGSFSAGLVLIAEERGTFQVDNFLPEYWMIIHFKNSGKRSAHSACAHSQRRNELPLTIFQLRVKYYMSDIQIMVFFSQNITTHQLDNQEMAIVMFSINVPQDLFNIFVQINER